MTQPKGFFKENGKTKPRFEKKGIKESDMNISIKGNNDMIKVDVPKKSKVQVKEEFDDFGSGLSKKQIDAIKEHLEKDEEIESIETEDNGFRITTSGAEYLYFENDDDAERYAIERIENDLENEPEIFNESLLQNHLTMTETDRNMVADEESERYFDGFSEEEILDKAEEEDLIDSDEREKIEKLSEDEDDRDKFEKRVRELGDKLQEKKYDEIHEELADPVQYFVHDQGLYSIEDLMKQGFVHINYEDAAEQALNDDGIGHFLSGYDGVEINLTDGGVMFRTN